MRMPSINIRELRDTPRLKARLRAGKTVELRERNTVIAKIVPVEAGSQKARELPDFEARQRAVFDNRILPGSDLVIEERGRY